MDNNEILKKGLKNREEIFHTTLKQTEERINKILEECKNKKNKYHDLYTHLFNELPTISLEINPLTNDMEKVSDQTINKTENNDNFNWCNTCENTTLENCLKCINGSENPNYKKSTKSSNQKFSDQVDNLEKHFIETVKNAKTENLEKIYDIISDELFSRYIEDEPEKVYQCETCKNCGTTKYIPSIKIKTLLTKEDREIISKEIEKKINEVFDSLSVF